MKKLEEIYEDHVQVETIIFKITNIKHDEDQYLTLIYFAEDQASDWEETEAGKGVGEGYGGRQQVNLPYHDNQDKAHFQCIIRQ